MVTDLLKYLKTFYHETFKVASTVNKMIYCLTACLPYEQWLPNFATYPAPTVAKTLKQVMSKYGYISPYKVKMHIIYTTGSLYYIVHDPEGQSVPSELNKVHCAFWEDIHPNDTKTYDSSAVKVASSFYGC